MARNNDGHVMQDQKERLVGAKKKSTFFGYIAASVVGILQF